VFHVKRSPFAVSSRPSALPTLKQQFRRGSSQTVTTTPLPPVPGHVAIIMDGNGRWAERRGLPRPLGHREGSDAVRRVTRACRRMGVQALTLFAFSEQNWQRSRGEVDALMELLCEFLLSERAELIENDIKLRAVGRVHRLPERVRRVLAEIERDTSDLSRMTLTLALSYGGREEIVDAVRELATRVREGRLDASAIDESAVRSALPSVDVGDVDLLIRTGGEQRISNFMLFGAAYAELYFSEQLWPDFGDADLTRAFDAFRARDRRFGRTTPTVSLDESMVPLVHV
jgi:undecaprenyl diphosphate synthase